MPKITGSGGSGVMRVLGFATRKCSDGDGHFLAKNLCLKRRYLRKMLEQLWRSLQSQGGTSEESRGVLRREVRRQTEPGAVLTTTSDGSPTAHEEHLEEGEVASNEGTR